MRRESPRLLGVLAEEEGRGVEIVLNCSSVATTVAKRPEGLEHHK